MTQSVTNNKKVAALVATFLVLGVLGTASIAGAYGGGQRSGLSEEDREIIHELREEIHEFVEAGDIDSTRDLISESDLGDEAKGHVQEQLDRREHRQAIKEALENDDYDAFVDVTSDAPFADQVDEDFFEALQEAHELREAGDYEGARGVLEEAGIDLPHHKKHRGKGGSREIQN